MTQTAPPKKILLTRPRPSSERWAALLARHNYVCFIEPLLTIKPTSTARPPGQYQAIMISSANALDALEENRAAIADLLTLPCFCVGAVTGEAARTLGFTDIRSGTGGSADLAQMMLTDLGDRTRRLLHIAGDIVDAKAGEILAAKGYTLALWPVYEASAAADLSPSLIAALKNNEIAATPIFSPRSARILTGLLEKNQLTTICHGITAIALSQAVADVLQSLPWRRLCVAQKPNEEEILACLQSEPSMTEPVPASPPSQPSAPKKKNGFLWLLLALLLLSVGAAYYMQYCPWFQAAMSQTAPNTQIAALEKRVTALETRLTTEPATGASTTSAPQTADLSTLNENIKNLQTQIEDQKNQSRRAAQKIIAEAFAFWDLRAAASTGRGFAPQLAALHAVATEDAALNEQASKLDAYAITGAPSWPELHDTFIKQESSATAAQTTIDSSTLWARVKSIMSNLISVHSAHNPQFTALEDALAAGDATASQATFDALPEQTRKNLATWQTGFTARAAIDETLRALAAHFTSPAPMKRFFTFILQIAILAAVAIWLADRPGTARIEWHDTIIETSAAFLGLCTLTIAFAFYILFRVYHFLRHGPANWRMRRKISKMEQAQDQLTQGLVAIAAGNATEAGRLAVAARKNIGNGVAAQWLQAQAAQLAGDRRAATEIFRALASNPDAAVLGYRGLITEAKRASNWPEADRLIAELHHLKPATPWLSLMRMESAARRMQWGEAESALSHATAARLMDSAQGRRTRAALRIAVSRNDAAKADKDSALKAAEQAAQQAPDWLPATINLAQTLAATGHKRAALRLIERAWKTQPHPQLAEILRTQAATPLEAYKDTEHLCRINPDALESRLTLAEAALNADIWGEARRHLMASIDSGNTTQRVYKMLARLERRERGNEQAASSWLAKASEAPADPTWLCRVCGGAHEEWQPICIHCGSFDSLEWQSAGQSRGALPHLQGLTDD